MASRSAVASPSGTTSPASPITFGISADVDPTTATPHAMASIMARPNCSFQFRRVSDGCTSMVNVRRRSGISVEGTPRSQVIRSARPSSAARRRALPSWGPVPRTCKRQGPGRPGERSEQDEDALLLDETGDKANDRGVLVWRWPGGEQVGIHAELRDDAGRAGVAFGAQHPQRFAAAGNRVGAATKHAALEPAKRGRVVAHLVLPGEEQRARADASSQPTAVRGRQVVRLLVQVNQVGSDVTQHAAQPGPIEEVVATVEADRLDAQVVRVRASRRFEHQGSAAALVPRRWRHDDKAFDFGRAAISSSLWRYAATTRIFETIRMRRESPYRPAQFAPLPGAR